MGAGALPPPATVRGTACRCQAKGPSAGGKARHLHMQPAGSHIPAHTPAHTTSALGRPEARALCWEPPPPVGEAPHELPSGPSAERRAEGLNEDQTVPKGGREGRERKQHRTRRGWEPRKSRERRGQACRGGVQWASPLLSSSIPASLATGQRSGSSSHQPSLHPQKARDTTAAPGTEGPVTASQWPAAGRKDWPLLHSDASLPPAGGASPCPCRLCRRRSP